MKTTSSVVVASFAFGLLVACGGQSSQTAPATAQGPVPKGEGSLGVMSAQNGVDRKTVENIAEARCAAEQRCNNIGPGQKYKSRDACVQQVVSGTSNDMNAASCPRGLDQDAINRCMNAIDNEPCSLSLDTLAQLVDCRAEALCVK
jgi:hypothetical protein